MIKRNEDIEFKFVGEITVDSGQVIVVDPCYVENGLDYEKVCEANERKNHEITVSGIAGTAVTIDTAYGDGIYPVFAGINEEGRTVTLVIDFEGVFEE